MPTGSSSAFTARNTPVPSEPTSRSYQGTWSVPTPWWWLIEPPVARIASLAAVLADRHCATGSSAAAQATVKYSDAPVGYTCETWHRTTGGVPCAASDSRSAPPTASYSRPTEDQNVTVSSVSTSAPASSSAS